MPYHRPTLDRLDNEDELPTGRHELIQSIGRHSPETLAGVDAAMTRAGIPEEHHLDLGYELLNNDAEAGGDIGPYREPQMSTTGRVVDVLGKLIGGIGAGISQRNGNAAFAASDFIRGLTRDQQLERDRARADWDARRQVGLEQRTAGREEQRWQWEKGSAEYELSKRDPNSAASQAARQANLAMFRAMNPGAEITPEMQAAFETSTAEQTDKIMGAFDTGIQRLYEQKRDQEEDKLKRDELASRHSLAAATAANTQAYQQATLDMRRQQMLQEQGAAQQDRHDKMAELLDEVGPEGMAEMGYAVPGQPAPTQAPGAPVSVPGASSAAPGVQQQVPVSPVLPPKTRREVAAHMAKKQAEDLAKEQMQVPSMQAANESYAALERIFQQSDDVTGPWIGMVHTVSPSIAQAVYPDFAEAMQHVSRVIKGEVGSLGAGISNEDVDMLARGVMSPFLQEGKNLANLRPLVQTIVARHLRATGQQLPGRDEQGRSVEAPGHDRLERARSFLRP